jgi:hypothetical protein
VRLRPHVERSVERGGPSTASGFHSLAVAKYLS